MTEKIIELRVLVEMLMFLLEFIGSVAVFYALFRVAWWLMTMPAPQWWTRISQMRVTVRWR